jgi:predicted dehydrogenase
MISKYKIALIGLGSIGKRHIINIDTVLRSRNTEYTIDLIRRNNRAPLDESVGSIITNIYDENTNVPDDYDVIFITNPTSLHFETIKKYSHKTKNMFIEKPVFDSTKVNLADLELKNDSIYYVACPLRYTSVIQYIKNHVDLKSVYSARAICSSYLPDWRPGIDYRNTYSAHADQGGGVSIDLIHEWDYMMYLFGKPKMVYNLRGKFSNLNIDSDDLSIYVAKYDNMLAEVHLDYFGREAIRKLELFTADETIIADIINSEIHLLKNNELIRFNEDRNSYQIKEIENFFDVLSGNTNNYNDICTAFTTLMIAQEGALQ